MACNCMGCPHPTNCRCRCGECKLTPLQPVVSPDRLVPQSRIDEAIQVAEGIQDPLGALVFLVNALGSPRPLTEAEKAHGLTLVPNQAGILRRRKD